MQHLVGSLLSVFLAITSAADSKEYEVKAAFLYNFAKFTEWPAQTEEADGKLNLCVAGDAPIGAVLDTLQGKDVQGNALNIRRIQAATELDDCQILFVTAPRTDDQLDTLMETAVGTQGLLSVSDIDGFTKRGGIIELKIIDNKVRFAINLRAARAAELQLSSKLLGLATAVER